MQKAIIIGATSGIGQEVARILVQQGWHIGIAGRRKEALHALQATCLLYTSPSPRDTR